MAFHALASAAMMLTLDPRRALRPSAHAAASLRRPLGWRAAKATAAGAAALVLALSAPHPAAFAGPPPAHGATEEADSPAGVIGQPARAWTFTRWARGGPLTLGGLRGKVVLVRWFTSGCRYCSNTLPSLEKLRKRYASQGLEVVCVFHPKPIRTVSDSYVRDKALELGFAGPLAVDEAWTTLDRWWLADHPGRNWTSVSFLIDQQGIVRWAQGGGEYHPASDPDHAACELRHTELERTIRRLLGVAPAAL